jgi:hypothetical protein
MTNKIIEYFKPDAVIEKPKADALLELTPEIKTKILSCKPINEATVHAATATSRRQARVWRRSEGNLMSQIVIQVDGKIRGRIYDFDIDKARQYCKPYFVGRTIIKEVVVPDKIINFITESI